jgi:hypothetical protein
LRRLLLFNRALRRGHISIGNRESRIARRLLFLLFFLFFSLSVRIFNFFTDSLLFDELLFVLLPLNIESGVES